MPENVQTVQTLCLYIQFTVNYKYATHFTASQWCITKHSKPVEAIIKVIEAL